VAELYDPNTIFKLVLKTFTIWKHNVQLNSPLKYDLSILSISK